MLNDLIWLVLAYLTFVVIMAAPAALLWLLQAFVKAARPYLFDPDRGLLCLKLRRLRPPSKQTRRRSQSKNDWRPQVASGRA
jgi:hypothetical protein